MGVSQIRSFYLREASRDVPTPVERASVQAVEGRGVLAQAFLSAAAGIEAQILVSRLDGDVSSAFTNAAQVEAAYGASVALVQSAQPQAGGTVDVVG